MEKDFSNFQTALQRSAWIALAAILCLISAAWLWYRTTGKPEVETVPAHLQATSSVIDARLRKELSEMVHQNELNTQIVKGSLEKNLPVSATLVESATSVTPEPANPAAAYENVRDELEYRFLDQLKQKDSLFTRLSFGFERTGGMVAVGNLEGLGSYVDRTVGFRGDGFGWRAGNYYELKASARGLPSNEVDKASGLPLSEKHYVLAMELEEQTFLKTKPESAEQFEVDYPTTDPNKQKKVIVTIFEPKLIRADTLKENIKRYVQTASQYADPAPYSVKQRPWYQEGSSGKPRWRIQPRYNNFGWDLSAVAPVMTGDRNDKQEGVVACNISLSKISSLLKEIATENSRGLGERGEGKPLTCFLYRQDAGKGCLLIASSIEGENESPVTESKGVSPPVPPNLSEARSPLLKSIGSLLEGSTSPDLGNVAVLGGALSHRVDKTDYWITLRPFQEGNQDINWVIGIAISKSDLVRPPIAPAPIVLVLVFGAGIAMVVGVVILQRASRKLPLAYEGVEQKLRQQEDDRNALKEQQHALREEENFAGDLCHDLRNPLQAAELNLDHFLKTNATSSDQGNKLNSIRQLITGALNLVTSVDAYYRKRERKPWQRVNIAKLLGEVVLQTDPQGRRKGLQQIGVRLETEEKEIKSDAESLLRILTNLVANGIRHTTRGSVVISVRKLDSDFFEFSVEDSGVGVSEDLIRTLTRGADYQYGKVAEHRGLGAGLSIARKLTKDLGGELRVERLPSSGSRFSVRIRHQSGENLETWTPGGAVRIALELEPEKRREILILVADDNIDALDALGNLFEHLGFRVARAASGRQALETMLQETPAIAFFDYELGDMVGTEICREIRERGLTFPVVIFSALEHSKESLEAGAQRFVFRPAFNEFVQIAAEELGMRFRAITEEKNDSSLSLPPLSPEQKQELRDFAIRAIALIAEGRLSSALEATERCVIASPESKAYLRQILELSDGGEQEYHAQFQNLIQTVG